MKLKGLFLIAGMAGLGYVIYKFIKKYTPQKDKYCEEVIIFPIENSVGTSIELCGDTKEIFEGQLADMLIEGTAVIRVEKL